MISYKEKELIKDYLMRYQTFNLIDVCNYLIDNGSSTDKYSTGKYKIYPYVAVFIESFETCSVLEIKRIKNNVQYNLIGELSIMKKIEDKNENEMKEEEKTPEIGQLSLF